MKPHTGKNIQCEYCKKEFYVPQYRTKIAKYCSRSCLALAARIQVITNCQICGEEFTHISSRSNKAKYCSRGCYYKSLKGKGSVELKCVVCGKSFLRPPSKAIYENPVCDITCRGLLMRKDNPGTPASARVWLTRRGAFNSCYRCGYDLHKEILIVHHKDHDRKNNLEGNLEVLCPNCHALEHYKKD